MEMDVVALPAAIPSITRRMRYCTVTAHEDGRANCRDLGNLRGAMDKIIPIQIIHVVPASWADTFQKPKLVVQFTPSPQCHGGAPRWVRFQIKSQFVVRLQ